MIGCGTAMVAALDGVVLANSRQAIREQSGALKARTEYWECTLQASYDRQLAMTDGRIGRPTQFVIRRMLILTAAIACLVSIPNMVHRLCRSAIENPRPELL